MRALYLDFLKLVFQWISGNTQIAHPEIKASGLYFIRFIFRVMGAGVQSGTAFDRTSAKPASLWDLAAVREGVWRGGEMG